MIVAHWLLIALLAAESLHLFYGNYSLRFRRYEAGKYYPSPTPIVGGVLGALAVRLAPPPTVSRFWWVPLCLDILVVMLLSTAYYQGREWMGKRSGRASDE